MNELNIRCGLIVGTDSFSVRSEFEYLKRIRVFPWTRIKKNLLFKLRALLHIYIYVKMAPSFI